MIIAWAAVAGPTGCQSTEPDPSGPGVDRRALLDNAVVWMYQIGGLDEPGAIEALDAADGEHDYAMLVLEPGHNFRPCRGFDTPEDFGIPAEYRDDACSDAYDTGAMIEALRQTPSGRRRLLIAYVDIGQAEWYRDYWVEGWSPPPGGGQRGAPNFIVSADPDAWLGNYPVAYWQEGWKQIWLGGSGADGIIRELAKMGFDGVYLDWVEAYDDESIAAAADEEGVDAAAEMVAFVEEIGQAGREVHDDFLVIAQNATFLLFSCDEGEPIDECEIRDRYARAIDALAVEDTWYYGNGNAEDWDAGDGDVYDYDVSERFACEAEDCPDPIEPPDNVCPSEDRTERCREQLPVAGDLHGGTRHACARGEEGTVECWSTRNRLDACLRYLEEEVPVFSIDYCISDDAARHAYGEARRSGLRPLVTRVSLSRNTVTPPWDYE